MDDTIPYTINPKDILLNPLSSILDSIPTEKLEKKGYAFFIFLSNILLLILYIERLDVLNKKAYLKRSYLIENGRRNCE